MENTMKQFDPVDLIQIYFSLTHSHGSLNTLADIIKQNNINISAQNIVTTMTTYLKNLSNIQQSVFRAYFCRQASVDEIYEQFDFDMVESAKKCLINATLNYIEMIKTDYGTN